MQLFEKQRSRISQYLRGRATTGVIERGIDSALLGRVIEYSRVGDTIQGIVAQDSPLGPSHSAKLEIVANSEINPGCTCGYGDEQWCEHGVALLWRAADLGFLDREQSLLDEEGYGARGHTPEEIATVITELKTIGRLQSDEQPFAPQVTLQLDFSSDKVGTRVLFDGQPLQPSLLRPKSSRALDNMLMHLLDEQGMWDEEHQLWFVSASSDVETLLGYAAEYDSVRALEGGDALKFSRELLGARIHLEWFPEGAELSLLWALPNGKTMPKNSELVGTGPYWSCIDNTIYRLSSSASKAAMLFTHSGVVTVPRSSVGPILQALTDSEGDSEGAVRVVEVANPKLQPRSKVANPSPLLDLERGGLQDEISGNPTLEVHASLDFEYPTPAEKDLVYLPDRVKEGEFIAFLNSLGFEPMQGSRKYRVRADRALDLISAGDKAFPDPWTVTGMDQLSKGLRFSELGLRISISSGGDTAHEGKIDWFDCHVALQQNGANVPLSSLFKNVRSDADRWVQLDSGAYARVPGGGIGNLKTSLGLLDPNFKLSNTIKAKLTSAQALSFNAVHDPNITLSMDAQLKTLIRKFGDFSKIEAVKPSSKFVGKLRSYQAEGLSWLHFLHDFDFGGILADEMGLGKTVQALSLLQKLRSRRNQTKSEKSPVLIVTPTSVMMNWAYEAKRFTPDLKVVLLHGPRRRENFSRLDEFDIAITSYALLRLDRIDLERTQFSYVILDEAQNIKNPDAAVTKAAKALRSKYRLALTGTPTENRPMELWSILDFLMPGYLGTNEFFKNFIEKPILEGGPGVEVTKFLRAKTKPFILRRLKAEVEKELPPKIESTVHVEMSSSQRRLYNQILEEVRPKVFASVEKNGIRGASVSILAALLRLRQVCNHPNSIDSLKNAPGYESGKFNAFKELLQEALDSGHKILLFAQFREMLSIMRRWLEEVGIGYLYLDGETRNRQDIVDKFNRDPNERLFLISLKAGGTGLNLATADTVIIYDPWWNPAVESQAVDRAHRIGQTRTVSVYRLVTEESIEQKIMDLKERKSKIVDALVSENALSTRALTRTDLEQLFMPLPMEGA